MDTLNCLKQNEAFDGAPDDILADLAAAGEERSFAPGEEVITQGETGKSVWVLLSGELVARIDGAEVNRLTEPGEVFGQISAVSHTAATATVRCHSEAKLLSIPHQALHDAMERSPELAASVLRSMAKYLGRP